MRTTILAIVIFFVFIASVEVFADDFYGYYTRLDYVIPIKEAKDYIPTELTEESLLIMERIEALEKAAGAGEDEEDEDEDEEDEEERRSRRRRRGSNELTGRFADVVINVADGQQLIFSRKTAYQPVWKTEKGEWPVEDIVKRQFDMGCLYSYARIIENSPTMIKVHWRYMPDLKNVGLTTVVHEFFMVTPDGMVERRVRQACEDLDDWNDTANVTVQKLKLVADGIKEVSQKRAKLSRLSKLPVDGSFVKSNDAAKPAAVWQFDEGLVTRSYDKKDITKEGVKGFECEVQGDVTLWKKGVSGTALAFDGYKSSVVCPASKTPKLDDEVTVEAWVVLGALP
ncbi:MAG: hypothetical protein ACYS0I_10520 [Planctomycetota bacterium]|jgi:hypothetical protein